MTLLGAAEIRTLAAGLELNPAKALGQNFVHDANICRKIVRLAGVDASDIALEIGPGLGSLTLALLEIASQVVAIEIDSRLATQLPITVAAHCENGKRLSVINRDALSVHELSIKPTALVANLPYNISVPVLLHYLERFASIQKGLVMVQAEVADRLVAKPGTKEYGIPTAKAAWWVTTSSAGAVSRSVFWPVPNVDSKLVAFQRHQGLGSEAMRKQTFALIDAAFAQRRKMLRSALGSWLESAKISGDGLSGSALAQAALTKAGIDSTLRGEALVIEDYLSIARALQEMGIGF